MARLAHEDGTKVLLATPHRKDVGENSSMEAVRLLVAQLNQAMAEQSLDVRLVLGMENFLTPDLPEAIRQGRALPINDSKYLLVELDFLQYPPYTDEVLFQLQLQGLVPIIVHPERQGQIQANPRLMLRLVERGVLSQVTAGSLLGAFGKRAQQVANSLIRHRLAHVMASDCHRASGSRAPGLSAGVAEVTRLHGAEVARTLVVDTPQALVEGRPVPLPEPSEPRRRWWPFRSWT